MWPVWFFLHSGMFIRKKVNGTQQTNKQTEQMGQKNVIEDLRSMEPQTNGTNWSEEGHKGNQVSVMK